MSEGLHSSAPDAAAGARSSATAADGSTAAGSADSVLDKYGRAHDPMCPWPDCGVGEPCPGYEDCFHYCQCDLIAKVRADERAQAGSRVAALPYWCDWSDGLVVYRSSAIGAAEGGDDK